METEPDGHRILPALVRLFARARHDAQDDEFEARALDSHQVRRQAARALELHLTSSGSHPSQARATGARTLAQAFEQGTLQRSGDAARHEIRRRTILSRSATGGLTLT